MKIEELYELNLLGEKCKLLCNNEINDEFYGFYFKNDLEWLYDNKKRIEDDFKNNKEKMLFDVILNSKFIDNTYEILSLKKKSIEEFAKFVTFIPWNILSKKEKNNIEKKFNEFKKKDDSLAYNYFQSIKRR